MKPPWILADLGSTFTKVCVVDGSSATRRSIRTGASSLSSVEIVSGLKVGDRIVVSGTDQFGSAERVRISGN